MSNRHKLTTKDIHSTDKKSTSYTRFNGKYNYLIGRVSTKPYLI